MAVADAIAQRSLCSRDKVGAVVVDAQNRVVDTGYNGPPRGYEGVRAAERFTEGLLPCSEWCPRAMTITSFPKRFDGQTIQISTGTQLAADYSDCPSLHAEANALMFSDRRLRVGGTIYVTSGMCSSCTKLIANSGLVRVVYRHTNDPHFAHRNTSTSVEFLEACGLEVIGVT